MSNLSDKEIDRLSREAADSYEPDGSYLSWSRLEQKLIEQLPERPPDGFSFGRFNPYLWGPAVVLIAGASFFFIKTSLYSRHSTQTSEPTSQMKTMSYRDSGKQDNRVPYQDISSSAQKKTTTSDIDPGIQPLEPMGVASSETKPQTSGADAARNSSKSQNANGFSGNQAATRSVDQAGSVQQGRSEILIPGAAVVTGSLASGNRIASQTESSTAQATASGANSARIMDSHALTGEALQTSGSKGQSEKSANTAKYSLPALAPSGIALGKVSASDSLLNRLTKSSSALLPQKSMHINRSLNIGFAFGADYTDAGGIPNNQLSNNIGITLGYYLTNKLSINTGINYSNKFYWSPGHEHNLPASSWNPPPPPPPAYYRTTYAYAPDIEYVNGACNMYEWPVTLRYDFAHDDKTKFFVNAGLSSYFMLKQTYIYFYHSGGRPRAFKSDIESQSNYWFGVGDLSFGLETDMGKGFSFQAEPFFRIPLQKMGFENLKMYSYGFMISFRYAPVLSRSKK